MSKQLIQEFRDHDESVEIEYWPIQSGSGNEYPSEELKSITYREKFGSYHRKGGPAIREWNPNGVKTREVFYENGRQHRVAGPALTTWYSNGKKCIELYMICGEVHCDGAPASFLWHPNGELCEKAFFVNGKLHCESGPAHFRWDKFGKKECENYYLEGKQLSREHWLEKLHPPKPKPIEESTIKKTLIFMGKEFSSFEEAASFLKKFYNIEKE